MEEDGGTNPGGLQGSLTRMREIERSYLVAVVPDDLEEYPSEEIKQSYLSLADPPLRIRQKGSKFEMTKKIFLVEERHSAEETTIPLTSDEFDLLWPLSKKSLLKTRYYIPLRKDGLIAELDVFKGKLRGLLMVEVEFNSIEQMNRFTSPSWFGRDVTNEAYASNFFLAGNEFHEIKGFFTQ